MHPTRFATLALCLLSLCLAASAQKPFVETTPGTPGPDGTPPQLSGIGSAKPGSMNELKLSCASAGGSAFLITGATELAAPFAGGVLGPAPDHDVWGGVVNGDGKLSKTFRMPPSSVTGTQVWVQYWIGSGQVSEWEASNTTAITVQDPMPTSALFPEARYSAGSLSFQN
ncbi:MAG: hypothetical protein DHS20C15_31380 [Planctomycetota bacterium]|nr:MAG: hypothetical protein DHS20C15_31380 [Planctomycetota bacterium]